MRTGGRILVDQLELNGVDLAFCLPGESYLPVLDALYDSQIRLITCRHEQGAANAAEAYGKLTGRPGICLVTRGPGATQAAVGVHTAKQDSSPMILLVGQVPRAFRGREAWQELDYERVFGGIAKAAWEIDSAARIPEHMAEAFSLALSGRPGPVVLALPEDVLVEEAEVADVARVEPVAVEPEADDLERLRDADVVLALGGRLGEVPTRRYTLLEPPDPRQTLVHVHPDPAELGRVYEPELAIAATLPELATALLALDPIDVRWSAWTAAARAGYERNLEHEPMEGDVDLGEIMAFLRRRLPADAVQTCGAGNFTVWAHRFAQFTQFGTQACPRSGSMGYGLPAAVAAQLLHRDRTVVCFTGDGDFVMSSPELATAVQYGLPIVVLLVNNGMYATIRMHQERQFPGRVVGTDLENPDFPALARAYGAHGERVGGTAGFEAAFERALASGRPSVLELPVDPERISPRVKLSELQAGR